MERTNFNALKKECPNWIHSTIDLTLGIEVLPEKALFLVRTMTGRRIMVLSSYFSAFAEETTTKTRFKSIQAYFTCLCLLCASGNITAHEVSRQQSLLRSFLMSVEGLDGAPNDETNSVDNSSNDDDDDCDDWSDGSDNGAESAGVESTDSSGESSGYRAARLLAMPKGYFAGPPPGILVVSQKLKIGYAEMLYIRHFTGPEMMIKLLKAHGYLLNGEPSPLELDWKCPGPPAAPGIEAEACTCQDSEPRPTTMFTGTGPGHPLYGLFICQRCHRKLPRRELAILLEWKSQGKLIKNKPLQERLKRLEERVVEHRQRDQVRRENHIRDDKDREKELVNDWNRQDRRAAKYLQDPQAHQKSRKRQREHDAAQIAKGKVKKPGVTRSFARIALYPEPFMKLLTRAARSFVKIKGKQTVYWNDIVDLFDALILREKDGLLSTMKIELMTDGKPRYLKHAYLTAVESILEKIPGRAKLWSVRDYNAEEARTAMRSAANIAVSKKGDAGLKQHVIDQLYAQQQSL